MSKKSKFLIGILSIGMFTIFITNPSLTINSMLQGINLWATKILPALFPFFVFTKILSTTGTFDYLALKLSPITKLIFNTSGLLYKSMELKLKLPTMTEDEQLKLLASDGMLVKRPIVIGEDFVLVGFKESEWSEILNAR